MNLYIISQSVNKDYDTYSEAIVAAESPDAAILMHPNGTCEYDQSGWFMRLNDGGRYNSGNGEWTDPENVKVEFIGTANEAVAPGVVLSSFHAG